MPLHTLDLEPRLLMSDHHRAIAKACRRLRSDVYTDDPPTLLGHYHCFERAVIEHMVIEERELLPAYTAYDPADAREIRHQHRELRELLDRIGLDVELHRVRASQLEQLLEAVQRHIAHEEATLYPWAQVNIPVDTKQTLFARLTQSLQDLGRVRTS
jgi:hypothetical protein